MWKEPEKKPPEIKGKPEVPFFRGKSANNARQMTDSEIGHQEFGENQWRQGDEKTGSFHWQ